MLQGLHTLREGEGLSVEMAIPASLSVSLPAGPFTQSVSSVHLLPNSGPLPCCPCLPCF